MIDFRYHLVSLISVFLALAVGIVLGAGPLKDTIGDQLSGQVEQLRSEKDALRDELKVTQGEADNARAFQDATATDLLVDQLKGKSVALIVLPDVPEETVEAVTERISQANGSVASQVTIATKWFEPGQRTFRQTIATQLLAGVESPPAANAGQESDLAAVLAVGLSQANPEDPSRRSDLAASIIDSLKGSELIVVDDESATPASGIIILAPSVNKKQPEDEAKAAAASFMAIALQGVQRTAGVVVAGPAAESDDLVRQIRESKEATTKVATVDGLDSASGQISVPMAFANAISAKPGHFGFRAGATAIAPPKVVAESAGETPAIPAE